MSESSSSRRFAIRTSQVGVAGLTALALTIGFLGGRGIVPAAAQTSTPMPQPGSDRVREAERPSSYSGIVNRVAPAVVTVRVESRMVATPTRLPDSLRDFFGRSLPEGAGPPRGYRQEGLGSGVITRADGYVLTNHHVVSGAERIRVELADRRAFDATVVGSDPASDLAVLKIGARDLPTIRFGDSAGLQVGDVVLAVGNPLGIGQTVTMGIVSAKGRATGPGDGSYEDFIQTDAPINQGSSGGALVNLQGELVGINAQILSPSGGNIGVGFAIPSVMVRDVSEQLIRDGVVHRSKLGVTVQPMTADLAASLGLKDVRGALVSGVEPDSVAAQAGLRQGDVITEFEGRTVLDANAVRNQVASARPGTAVSLKVLREGQEQQFSVRLVERDSEHESTTRPPEQPPAANANSTLGMLVEPVTAQLLARMRLPQGMTGLLITDLDPAGTAADSGLQPGDVITRANDIEIRSVSDLNGAIATRRDRPALLLVTRAGSGLFVALTPGS